MRGFERFLEVFRDFERFSEVLRGFQRFLEVFRGPLRDPLRGRFPSQRLSVLLPLIVLPLELSPRSGIDVTVGNGPKTVSGSAVSNTELSELFGAHLEIPAAICRNALWGMPESPRTSKFPIRLSLLSDTVWQTVVFPF